MKKRGTKLFTILLTAGMLAFTAAVGISANMITSTETISYQMEENADTLVDGGGMTDKILQDKKWFSDVERGIYKGNGYTRVNLVRTGKSETASVLLEANKKYVAKFGTANNGSAYHSRHVWVYTESSNRNVKCIGTLISNDNIAFKNGAIYARGDGTMEVYVLSPDKEHLVLRDYANIYSQMGHTNKNYSNFTHYYGPEVEDLYNKLRKEYDNATSISFKIK